MRFVRSGALGGFFDWRLGRVLGRALELCLVLLPMALFGFGFGFCKFLGLRFGLAIFSP